MLHDDNAPGHTSLHICNYLAKHELTSCHSHQPGSPQQTLSRFQYWKQPWKDVVSKPKRERGKYDTTALHRHTLGIVTKWNKALLHEGDSLKVTSLNRIAITLTKFLLQKIVFLTHLVYAPPVVSREVNGVPYGYPRDKYGNNNWPHGIWVDHIQKHWVSLKPEILRYIYGNTLEAWTCEAFTVFYLERGQLTIEKLK